jgi:hypothetical protein
MQSERSKNGQLLKPIEFADYLLEKKALSEGQLLDVLAESWLRCSKLSDSIVARGYLPPDEVERLAREYEDLQVVYV